jgi:hypothetical protein
MLAVGSPERVERAMGNPSSRRLGSTRDAAALIRVLGDRRSAHRLTAALYQPRDGVVRLGELLDDLPPTAGRLLGAQATAGGAQPTRVAELGRWEIELDGPVTGGLVVRLAVKAGDATAEGGDGAAAEGQP